MVDFNPRLLGHCVQSRNLHASHRNPHTPDPHMRLLLIYLLCAGATCLGLLHWLDADDLLPSPMRYGTWEGVLDFTSEADAVKSSASPATEGEK